MFLKKLMSHKLDVDPFCPDGEIYVGFNHLTITMSPKSYKRWSRLQKSPLLKIMFDN